MGGDEEIWKKQQNKVEELGNLRKSQPGFAAEQEAGRSVNNSELIPCEVGGNMKMSPAETLM